MIFADEPEHVLELRRMLQHFVAEEMPPEKVRQWDKEHRFPPELFAKLADTGVCGITIDPEYGGQGPDLVAASQRRRSLAVSLWRPDRPAARDVHRQRDAAGQAADETS